MTRSHRAGLWPLSSAAPGARRSACRPASPAAAQRAAVHSTAARSRFRRTGPSTASTGTRGCACGWTAARSTWARRRPSSAARPRRSGGGGRSWSNRARRGARLGDAARAAADATRLGRRRDLHRARLRRLQRALVATMAAWASSPYRAVGVYIGGVNRACSQPNLTSSWVATQTEAGWHLIPTYVGLQAPTSACSSCAKLTPAGRPPRAQRRRSTRSQRRPVGDRPRQPDLLRHGGLLADLQRHQRDPRLPRGLDREAARARLRLRRLQQQRLGDRRPRRPVRHRLRRCPTTSGSPTGTGRRTPLDPGVPVHRLDPAPAHPPVPGRPQRELRRGDDQHRQQLRRRGDGRRRRRLAGDEDPIGELDLTSAPAPGRCGSRAGPSTPTRRPNPRRSALVVGGKSAPPASSEYELGPDRQHRPPRRRHRLSRGGAPTTASTSASRRRLGLAVGLRLRARLGPGEDRLLGCKAANIPVAVRISHWGDRGNASGCGSPALAGGDRLPGTDPAAHPIPGSRSPTTAAAAPHPTGEPADRPKRLPTEWRRREDLPRPTDRRRPHAAAGARRVEDPRGRRDPGGRRIAVLEIKQLDDSPSPRASRRLESSARRAAISRSIGRAVLPRRLDRRRPAVLSGEKRRSSGSAPSTAPPPSTCW